MDLVERHKAEATKLLEILKQTVKISLLVWIILEAKAEATNLMLMNQIPFYFLIKQQANCMGLELIMRSLEKVVRDEAVAFQYFISCQGQGSSRFSG